MSRQPDSAAPEGVPERRGARSNAETLSERLEAGCAKLALGLGFDERERLLTYLDLMQRWNRVYNLTAVREPQAMLVQHILDSLAVLPALARWRLVEAADQPASAAPAPGRSLVDVGTGAGLPGMVLALTCPELDVELVEPVGKKAAFLRQCVAELGLAQQVRVHDRRVETLQLPAPEQIICRAFASLADYISVIASLVGPRTQVLAMKGRRAEIDAEAANLPAGWRLDAIVPLFVPGLDAERHLVRLRAPFQ
jgi:16S rRNA (guanine527-N7)-methyltransferase